MTNPHAGGGKGMYFIPEIGEEVLIGFENNNAEKPFVLGAVYNGSESSGYGTSGNDIKAIHTRSGHIIKFTEDESIIITDKSGNIIHLDTVGSNISITAPETINITCRNMNINVTENKTINVGSNMSTSVGMNKTNSVGVNQTETIGGMKSLSVGLSMLMTIIGKLTEIIHGDVYSETKKGETHINSDKGYTASSNGKIEKHSEKEIGNNSAEKSKQF